MVSMARPLLADADFVAKAAEGRADEINTCIACNQACLDHVFQRKIASCLVNPRAGHETELIYRAHDARRSASRSSARARRASPAPPCCAERGHAVDLFEAATEIGGQFNMAKRIPGKEEFHETLRYFGAPHRSSPACGCTCAPASTPQRCSRGDYDEIVLATGVTPRDPDIPGAAEHRASGRVLSYVDVLLHGRDGRARASRSSVRAASASTSPSTWSPSEHSPTLDLADVAARVGRRPIPRRARSGLAAPQIAPPRARSTCCSASRRRSARASARPPAGSTAPRSRPSASK